MVEAMKWISRVTTVVMEIVLPGLLGDWLDRRWGTGYLALVGFGFGLVCGIQHLLMMTRADEKTRHTSSRAAEVPDETQEHGEEAHQ
jgi:hypothetical protein